MATYDGESIHILNFNIGVLGHVDSGKTSLSKALSTIASTAAFDKNPPSKERGITLDLGFSSFLLDLPTHLKDLCDKQGMKDYEKLQITLVDCPGHASLLKTIIGGAQIIDMMILVVDIVKGMQTQTAECLIIGEILCDKMIVVLNKIDLIEERKREAAIEKMKKRLLKTLENTRFRDSRIIPVAAKIGGSDTEISESIGLDDLINCLKEESYLPKRSTSGCFLFSVDHCFSIKGKGTVMTGTVLNGSAAVNDTIEIPTFKETKKIKSMQMFRKPVKNIMQGDRAGILVTQFDPKRLERGLVCTPGYLMPIYGGILQVHKIPYFKGSCKNKSKLHITIGHETVMAKVLFFGPSPYKDINQYKNGLNTDLEYIYQEELDPKTSALNNTHESNIQYVILEFEKTVTCLENSLVIGSRLDTDTNLNMCRLVFHGKIEKAFTAKDYLTTILPSCKIFKEKQKTGLIERYTDDNTIIVKSLFKKESDISLFQNMKVSLSTGENGNIQGTFGQSGKIKVYIPNGLAEETKTKIGKTKGKGKGKKDAEMENLDINKEPVQVKLEFKKYIYDNKNRMIQS